MLNLHFLIYNSFLFSLNTAVDLKNVLSSLQLQRELSVSSLSSAFEAHSAAAVNEKKCKCNKVEWAYTMRRRP